MGKHTQKVSAAWLFAASLLIAVCPVLCHAKNFSLFSTPAHGCCNDSTGQREGSPGPRPSECPMPGCDLRLVLPVTVTAAMDFTPRPFELILAFLGARHIATGRVPVSDVMTWRIPLLHSPPLYISNQTFRI